MSLQKKRNKFRKLPKQQRNRFVSDHLNENPCLRRLTHAYKTYTETRDLDLDFCLISAVSILATNHRHESVFPPREQWNILMLNCLSIILWESRGLPTSWVSLISPSSLWSINTDKLSLFSNLFIFIFLFPYFSFTLLIAGPAHNLPLLAS